MKALFDLLVYYETRPENNNTRAAKQAIKEILSEDQKYGKQYIKSQIVLVF